MRELLHQTWLKFRALVKRRQLDRDLEDELAFHLAMREERRRASGLSREEAPYAARREFGNPTSLKERCREMWTFVSLEAIWQDVRFGARMLRRNPGFTLVAILTLALGIGANTAIFSVIHAVLLRPLPLREPDRLVQLWETEAAAGNYPLTGADFLDWRTQNRTFVDLSTFSYQTGFNASGAGEPERVAVVQTQANFFSLLGMSPALGRDFLPGEDTAGRNHVALLSHGFWQRHFGGAPDVLQRQVELNNATYAVVGVLPAWYRMPAAADLWIPLDMSPEKLGPRGEHHLRAIGRLKGGVTITQAREDLRVLAAGLEHQYPSSNQKVSAVVVPLEQQIKGNSTTQLWVMFGAVGLVLLIACANVANLMLARAAVRRREAAVRVALGAGRARLIRQLLTESILLSVCGGVAGLGLAYLSISLLNSAKSIPVPLPNPVGLNPAVLLFTFGVCAFVGVLSGLAPALQASRVDLSEQLKASSKSVPTVSSRSRTLRDALVVVEIALSLALFAGAALLLRTFANLREVDFGVHNRNALTASLLLSPGKYATIEQRKLFLDNLCQRLESAPGVRGAGIVTQLPLEGGRNGYVTLEGQDSRDVAGQLVEWNAATPDYFRVMGIPLLAGSGFTEADLETTAARLRALEELEKTRPLRKEDFNFQIPALIDRTMAEKFWPRQQAVGKLFHPGGWMNARVVGVVGETREWGIRQSPIPQTYYPLTWDLDQGGKAFSIVVEGTGNPEAMAGTLRAVVRSLDASLPVFQVRTLPQMVSDSMPDTNYQTLLLGVFAGVALLIALVGIYGVISYAVSQRTNEIGIRMALGAGRGDVLRMVVGHGAGIAAIGVGLGVALALALTRLLSDMLYGVKPMDPLTHIAVAALVFAVSSLACFLPARRAARVDPVVALRYE